MASLVKMGGGGRGGRDIFSAGSAAGEVSDSLKHELGPNPNLTFAEFTEGLSVFDCLFAPKKCKDIKS